MAKFNPEDYELHHKGKIELKKKSKAGEIIGGIIVLIILAASAKDSKAAEIPAQPLFVLASTSSL